jgi:hypothetical protein
MGGRSSLEFIPWALPFTFKCDQHHEPLRGLVGVAVDVLRDAGPATTRAHDRPRLVVINSGALFLRMGVVVASFAEIAHNQSGEHRSPSGDGTGWIPDGFSGKQRAMSAIAGAHHVGQSDPRGSPGTSSASGAVKASTGTMMCGNPGELIRNCSLS